MNQNSRIVRAVLAGLLTTFLILQGQNSSGLAGAAAVGEAKPVIAPQAAAIPAATSPQSRSTVGNLSLVGQIGGFPSGIAVVGNRAYVTLGPRLGIFDLSNPAQTTLIGQTTLLPFNLTSLTVSGDYAYATYYLNFSSGLAIFDVHDPANPTLVGQGGGATLGISVAVLGMMAFVADGSYGLKALDISNPTSTGANTTIGAPGSWTNSVAISNGNAYTVDGNGYVHVYQVAPTINYTEIMKVATNTAPTDITIAGQYAYVVGKSFLQIIDISQPSTAHVVGTTSLSAGYTSHVSVSGNFAYATNTSNGILVVDVSSPTNPHSVGSFIPAGVAANAVAVGPHLYVTGSSGLQTVDVSNASSPREMSSYHLPVTNATNVTVGGTTTYVTNSMQGLDIIDVSQPAAPTGLGALGQTSQPSGITLDGNRVYEIANDGLHIVDVSSPTHPVEVGLASTTTTLTGAAVQGQTAFTANSAGTFASIDISNPGQARQLGTTTLPSPPHGIAMNGSCAYVATESGLAVVGTSKPAAPSVLQTVLPVEKQYGVAVSGNRAYSISSYNVDVYNLGTASTPQLAGSISAGLDPGPIIGLAAIGNLVAVAGSNHGFSIVDATDPAHLTRLAGWPVPGYVGGVAVSGNYVYVAAGFAGLYIFQAPLSPTSARVADAGPYKIYLPTILSIASC